MKMNSSGLLKVISIVLPIIIAIGVGALILQNYLYNNLERVCSLSKEYLDGTKFVFEDITVEIATRGGDSGAWSGDELTDSEGNIIYEHSVGTIYELVIINNTADTISDWEAVLYIPEDMFVNNTWNGDFEYHQNVKAGNEKVQTLDLAEYSQYDIILDHYIAGVGPMIVLHEGDYFVYFPDADMNETPIAPKPESSKKESSVRIGFIMYIADREIDYVADFSVGEIRYRLQTSVFKNPFFWVLGGMTIVWISCLLSLIIVKSNLKRFIEQKKRDEIIIEQIMQTFVNFMEAKDPSTMGHSLRVAQYSRLIAQKLGFSEEECYQVHCIALMHDSGKLYIPDEILSKPGKLTEEEYEAMKKHTVYGKEILRDFTAIENMGTGALSHHERYDGKGYPNGLAGEEIPVIARIICVCDSFDAMNSRRCYRNNLSREVIIGELQNNKGKQFDPNIVDCLMSLIESGEILMSDSGKNENT